MLMSCDQCGDSLSGRGAGPKHTAGHNGIAYHALEWTSQSTDLYLIKNLYKVITGKD